MITFKGKPIEKGNIIGKRFGDIVEENEIFFYIPNGKKYRAVHQTGLSESHNPTTDTRAFVEYKTSLATTTGVEKHYKYLHTMTDINKAVKNYDLDSKNNKLK